MTLLLDDDQQSLAHTLRDALTDTTGDDRVWALLDDDLELTGLGIPEDLGGGGGGYRDLAVVFTEIGRSLRPDPLLPHVTAVHLLALLTASNRASHPTDGTHGDSTEAGLTQALAGTLRLGLALHPVAVVPEPDAASAAGTLTTTTTVTVLGSADSDAFVLPVTDVAGRLRLMLVRADDPGVEVRAARTLDVLQPQALVTLTDAPARLLGEPEATERAWTGALRVAALALSALQVGGAARALDEAVEYARIRFQFGRAIGSFQAIKHQLATQFWTVRSAEVAVAAAARALEHSPDDEETARLLLLVQATAGDAYVEAAHRSLQVHGGIGFTMETDCHLHVRRAHAARTLLGAPDQHREELARLLLRPAA